MTPTIEDVKKEIQLAFMVFENTKKPLNLIIDTLAEKIFASLHQCGGWKEVVKERIEYLKKADAEVCEKRWGNITPALERMVARETSNFLTERRHELEELLKTTESESCSCKENELRKENAEWQLAVHEWREKSNEQSKRISELEEGLREIKGCALYDKYRAQSIAEQLLK